MVLPTSGFGTNVTHARYNYRATVDSCGQVRVRGGADGKRDGWFIE